MPWLTDDGIKEEPIIIFELPTTTLGYNLHAITEIVVTCREQGSFGLEFVNEKKQFDPNMLVMGSISVAATLKAWQEAQA